MRTRRSQLGLTGVELAQRAGISPSYVSLIERGAKVPDEDVAAGLARALDDDEDLYRAWARAARLGLHKLDLLNRFEVISRTPGYLSLVESGQALPKLEPPGGPSRQWDEAADLASRLRDVAARLTAPPRKAGPAVQTEPDARPADDSAQPPAPGADDDVSAESAIIRIPVLAEGADPGRLAPSPLAIRDRLLVDRRLVDDHEPERLFAYDVTPRAMKHLRGLASPGDRIVFLRAGHVGPDRICAVRAGGDIILSRVLFKGRSLLLLPGEGEPDFESIDVQDLRASPGVIAGTHVLLIRR